MAYLIGYDLKKVLTNNVGGKAQLNKVYLILIVALESSQFLLVKKDHNPSHGMIDVEVIPLEDEPAIGPSTHAEVLTYKDGRRKIALRVSHHHVQPCRQVGGGNEVKC